MIWTAILPLWHAPDEAAHFSSIQKIAEAIDLKNTPRGFGASRELQISEQFLETERGDDGTTSFTFNPQYKIKYSNNQDGIYEREIKNIPIELRKESVHHEQAYYPPLYYQTGKFIYQIFYQTDIIFRAFAIRLFSILAMVGMVIVSFFLAKEIFPQKRQLQLALPIIVSFHPMLSFVSSGINSDNLANFFFSLFLLISVYFIIRGSSIRLLAIMAVVVGLGFFIKPQFIIALALAISLLLFDLIKSRNILQFIKNSLIFFVIMVLAGGFLPIQEAIANYRESAKALPYIEAGTILGQETQLSFIQHLKNSIYQTIAQTFPWYWGVFKWLSLTLPRVVNQILMRMMLFGAIGLILKFSVDLKKRDFSRINQALFFLAFSIIVFFFAIIWRDYQHIRTNSFSLGIQGRYFFPVIIAHMSLLYVGLLTLVPEKFKKIAGVIFTSGAIALNFIALYVLAASSYNLNSFTVFINQVSQYKPWYFKGELFVFWLTAYFLTAMALIFIYLKITFNKPK